MNPLLLLSATELARRIAAGAVSSREVVEAHIARIEQVNPVSNAVVRERFAAARAEADAADAAVAEGRPLGPLHGVPCTIKEAFSVVGMPWTSGLKARVGTVGEVDAVTVQRLRAAGAIVLGVTNTSELCMWMESDNPVYGRTANAYDPGRIAGGSSGGEGSIVGSGGSPFGLGADVGGSIRMPAFFNGVFGHKPGMGVVPNSGQFPQSSTEEGGRLLSTGPIARRSEDLFPLLRILAGSDDEDAVSHDLPLGDPASVRLDGLTVLDVPGNGLISVAPALRQAQERVAAWLASQGAVVRQAHYPAMRQSFDIWSTAMGSAEGGGAFRKLLRRPRKRDLLRHLVRPSDLGGEHTLPAVLLGLLEDVGSAFPARTRRFQALRDTLHDELVRDLGHGVLLFPSYPEPAPRHRRPLLKPLHWTYTALFNAMGFPVTQVPLGFDPRGVPVGLQVVGAPGHDHVTIAVAQALERGGLAGWTPPSA